MTKMRGFAEPFLALIVVVIGALIAYALLSPVANQEVFAEQRVNGADINYSNISGTTRSLMSLGPTMYAIAALLMIIGGGFAVYGAFGGR